MSLNDTDPFFYTQPSPVDNNNVTTDTEGGERFFLGEMNVNITSSLASLHGGSDTNFNDVSGNAWSTIDVPLSYARNLFQYQTDAVDVNDLNSQDIKFRMYHLNSLLGDISGNTLKYFNTKNIIPTESLVYFNAIPFYGNSSVDSSSNELKVNADFVRHVAKELFGVSATDLFNNEVSVRNGLNTSSASSFNTQIQNLVNFRVDNDFVRLNDVSGNTTANKFPSKLILKQILDNVKSRLSNIDGSGNELIHMYDNSGNSINLGNSNVFDASGNRISPANQLTLWRKIPLMVNDMLFFKITVDPDANQSIKTGQLVNPRSYRVRMKVVQDTDPSVVSWTANGWDGTNIYTTGAGLGTV